MNELQTNFFIQKAITESMGCNLWNFYPEVTIECKKKKKCCKSFKTDKRCKKCPANS